MTNQASNPNDQIVVLGFRELGFNWSLNIGVWDLNSQLWLQKLQLTDSAA